MGSPALAGLLPSGLEHAAQSAVVRKPDQQGLLTFFCAVSSAVSSSTAFNRLSEIE